MESASFAMHSLCSFEADRPSISLLLCYSISGYGRSPDRKTTGFTNSLRPELIFGKGKTKKRHRFWVGQPGEKLNFGHLWSRLVIFGHLPLKIAVRRSVSIIIQITSTLQPLSWEQTVPLS